MLLLSRMAFFELVPGCCTELSPRVTHVTYVVASHFAPVVLTLLAPRFPSPRLLEKFRRCRFPVEIGLRLHAPCRLQEVVVVSEPTLAPSAVECFVAGPARSRREAGDKRTLHRGIDRRHDRPTTVSDWWYDGGHHGGGGKGLNIETRLYVASTRRHSDTRGEGKRRAFDDGLARCHAPKIEKTNTFERGTKAPRT